MLRTINDILWGPGTLALLLGTGLYLTVRTRFLPWRELGRALRAALGRESRQAGRGGVSPFSALMTALAATIGTGNIVGVATALAAGGPGALVWMELAALLGLATKFSECFLSVKYRRRDREGRWTGGPMYVMSAALGRPGRWMGTLYALFALTAAVGVGSMTQSNSIASALHAGLGVPPAAAGAVTAALALAVLLGGVRRVAAVSSALVPAMAALYLLGGLAVIACHRAAVPAALGEMVRQAFSFRAAAGGAAGTAALRWGAARGVLSNEAGMGSAAIAAASAEGSDPVRQGYVAMTAVFFDTCLICTVTGLAVCASGVLETGRDGAELVLLAFQSALGPRGGAFLCAAVTLFAFTTVVGWSYQGEAAFTYLFGGRRLPLYRVLYALAAYLGAGAAPEAVFQLTDICNALMCLPNLACLLALSGVVAREARPLETEKRPPQNGRARGKRGGFR